MTGKLTPAAMLRRLDLITERRGQARQRRREAEARRAGADPPRKQGAGGGEATRRSG